MNQSTNVEANKRSTYATKECRPPLRAKCYEQKISRWANFIEIEILKVPARPIVVRMLIFYSLVWNYLLKATWKAKEEKSQSREK